MAPSLFERIIEAPADPILGTEIAYRADQHPQKVNLGIGAYRTEGGVPYVFPVVGSTETQLATSNIDKEYLPIDGLPELKRPTQELVFGKDFNAISEKRITTLQVLSGTGGLRVAAEFVRFQLPDIKEVYISNPSWSNHRNIFGATGFVVKEYTYWNAATKGFDLEGMLNDLKMAPAGSLVVLHACAHNPTGVDPTKENWRNILDVVKENKLVPLFDSAYQGYGSGDLDEDAFAIRFFAKSGMELFVTQSFAKNLGLYGERVGMLHIVCNTPQRASVILSQLKIVVRRMYSSPPGWGARIVASIFNDKKKMDAWQQQLKAVAARLQDVRRRLRDGLVEKETPGNWDHIVQQIGMFSYTGLTPQQCERMTNQWHIHLLKSGRISLAGLNSGNLQYVIDAIDDCIRSVQASNL